VWSSLESKRETNYHITMQKSNYLNIQYVTRTAGIHVLQSFPIFKKNNGCFSKHFHYSFDTLSTYHLRSTKGQCTHEPRAMTMKVIWAQMKWPKAVPRHIQNHVVRWRALKCSVKSYVTRPSTKCSFNEFLFMRDSHTWKKYNQTTYIYMRSWSAMPRVNHLVFIWSLPTFLKKLT